jgi:hypothetical protein
MMIKVIDYCILIVANARIYQILSKHSIITIILEVNYI